MNYDMKQVAGWTLIAVCVGAFIGANMSISIGNNNTGTIHSEEQPLELYEPPVRMAPPRVVYEPPEPVKPKPLHTEPAPGYGVVMGSDGKYYWVDLSDNGMAMFGCDDIQDSIDATWRVSADDQRTFTRVK